MRSPVELKQTYENDKIHESWESVYRLNPLQDRFNEALLDRHLRLLRPGPDALFLDAGCGVGYHALALARRGFRCVGVDISETILESARKNARSMGLENRARFECQMLEALSFDEGTFDAVHCRGVLMHIPQWHKALAELCRVLKPGGKILVIESNAQAVEARLVCWLRGLRRSVSRVVHTPAGPEFWSEKDGQPFLVRITCIDALVRGLENHGVRMLHRLATEFWDIFRFPAGLCRDAVIRFNQLWFGLRLPAGPSVGNGIIGEKT
jgi:ubiquinone/menaquinone biosynthesis C-methylase UbiE